MMIMNYNNISNRVARGVKDSRVLSICSSLYGDCFAITTNLISACNYKKYKIYLWCDTAKFSDYELCLFH
jgi:hypothetical protein